MSQRGGWRLPRGEHEAEWAQGVPAQDSSQGSQQSRVRGLLDQEIVTWY